MGNNSLSDAQPSVGCPERDTLDHPGDMLGDIAGDTLVTGLVTNAW